MKDMAHICDPPGMYKPDHTMMLELIYLFLSALDNVCAEYTIAYILFEIQNIRKCL